MSHGGPLPVPRNLEQFPELHPALTAQEAFIESNRCLYCFDAPCTAACPTHIDVPRFIKKIASGNLRGSAGTILDANILGASCARVCPVDVLCEGACVLKQQNKKPIEIGRLQRFAMDAWYDAGAPARNTPVTMKQRVACIGGGPASLACAAELRLSGLATTVFDNRPLPGGLNTYGVAEYKMRPSDSLREVDLVRRMGVEFRQAEVGRDVTLTQLEAEFDFVFLGVGLGSMERLGIPGEDLPGVLDALHFISRYKTSDDLVVGRKVVVIGGGNTAIDAANAARRLGAEEVHIFYRRSEPQMPAFSFEYHHSQLEGVRFHFLAQPVAIMGSSRVTGVRCERMQLGEPDATGRSRPMPVPYSEFVFECDMVIPALGQSRLTVLLNGCPGIELDGGCVKIDRATGRTGNPRYYAGGDCVNGGREVVDAVADGKRAARAILAAIAQGN